MDDKQAVKALQGIIVEYYKRTGDILNLDAYLFSQQARTLKIPQFFHSYAEDIIKDMEGLGLVKIPDKVKEEVDPRYYARLGLQLATDFVVIDATKDGNPTTLHSLGKLLGQEHPSVMKAFSGATFNNGLKEGTYFLPRLDVESFDVMELDDKKEVVIGNIEYKVTIPRSRYNLRDVVLIPLGAYKEMTELLSEILSGGLVQVKLFRGATVYDRVYTTSLDVVEDLYGVKPVVLKSLVEEDLTSFNIINLGLDVYDIRNTKDELLGTNIRVIDTIEFKPFEGNIDIPDDFYASSSFITLIQSLQWMGSSDLIKVAKHLGMDLDYARLNVEDVRLAIKGAVERLRGFELYGIVKNMLGLNMVGLKEGEDLPLGVMEDVLNEGIYRITAVSKRGSLYSQVLTRDIVVLDESTDIFKESASMSHRYLRVISKVENWNTEEIGMKDLQGLLLDYGVFDGRYINMETYSEWEANRGVVPILEVTKDLLIPALQAVNLEDRQRREESGRERNEDIIYAFNPLALTGGKYFASLNKNRIVRLEQLN